MIIYSQSTSFTFSQDRMFFTFFRISRIFQKCVTFWSATVPVLVLWKESSSMKIKQINLEINELNLRESLFEQYSQGIWNHNEEWRWFLGSLFCSFVLFESLVALFPLPQAAWVRPDHWSGTGRVFNRAKRQLLGYWRWIRSIQILTYILYIIL